MGVILKQKVKGRGNPWYVEVNCTIDGKKFRKQKKFNDKKAGEAFRKQMEIELAQKKFGFKVKSEKTFGKYAEEWLKITVKNDCKKSTRQDYKALLENHILPVFGDRPIDEITRGEISDFLNGKQSPPSDQSKESGKPIKAKSRSTVLHMKAVISGVMRRALDHEAIQANPVHYIKVGKKQDAKEKISPFTQDQLNAFLKIIAEDHPAYYELFYLLAGTGCRLGEALYLKWGDIDWDKRTVNIERSIVRNEESTPKSGKSRIVDLSPALTKVMRNHKQRFPLAPAGEIKPLVFANDQGNYLDKNNLRKRVFQKALEKLVKVPELKLSADEKKEVLARRIHDLRHTYATLRISRGDNIADVSNQLGHYSVKLTLDVYYHWMPGKNKSEVDALDDVIATFTPSRPTEKQTETKKGAAEK